MVKIKWRITDDIRNISLKEFNTEVHWIYGYFELDVNDKTVGHCPDKESFPVVLSCFEEDITDWLYQLPNMIIQLNDCDEYEWELLDMNLLKIVIKREDTLLISLIHSRIGIQWSERVTYQEYITELLSTIDRFVEEIRTLNSELLKSKTLTDIIEIRDTLSHSPLLNSPNS